MSQLQETIDSVTIIAGQVASRVYVDFNHVRRRAFVEKILIMGEVLQRYPKAADALSQKKTDKGGNLLEAYKAARVEVVVAYTRRLEVKARDVSKEAATKSILNSIRLEMSNLQKLAKMLEPRTPQKKEILQRLKAIGASLDKKNP